LVLTADEEMGATYGAQWLCAEHPEAVRSDLVVNEGGGAAFELGGRRFYTLCVGEKGVNRFLLRARGKAGHASVPALGDNALLKLAPALTRFRDQAPIEPTPAGVAFLSALLDEDLEGAGAAQLEAALERLRSLSPALASYVAEPMLRVTFVPTRSWASNKDNVIPSRAEVLVDCRVPPGGGIAEAEARLAELLGPLRAELEVEFTETVTGNSSPADAPFAETIAACLADLDPEATVVPIVMAGFSDSHWFRKAFGTATVYGFCPQRKLGLFEAAPLIHSADERAAVSDIAMAATFYADLCRRVLR
jgi:acetylornithine deacetylase/succinyl-diaminopimelate desuccinylase-like protein